MLDIHGYLWQRTEDRGADQVLRPRRQGNGRHSARRRQGTPVAHHIRQFNRFAADLDFHHGLRLGAPDGWRSTGIFTTGFRNIVLRPSAPKDGDQAGPRRALANIYRPRSRLTIVIARKLSHQAEIESYGQLERNFGAGFLLK